MLINRVFHVRREGVAFYKHLVSLSHDCHSRLLVATESFAQAASVLLFHPCLLISQFFKCLAFAKPLYFAHEAQEGWLKSSCFQDPGHWSSNKIFRSSLGGSKGFAKRVYDVEECKSYTRNPSSASCIFWQDKQGDTWLACKACCFWSPFSSACQFNYS